MHPGLTPSALQWNNVDMPTGTPRPPPRWGHSTCIVN